VLKLVREQFYFSHEARYALSAETLFKWDCWMMECNSTALVSINVLKKYKDSD
jgi:hypothetical protein